MINCTTLIIFPLSGCYPTLEYSGINALTHWPWRPAFKTHQSLIDGFVGEQRIITDIGRHSRPDDRIPQGRPPPPVPRRLISRTPAFRLHWFPADCAFINKTLHRIEKVDSPIYVACGEVEDTRHIMCACVGYSDARELRCRLRIAGIWITKESSGCVKSVAFVFLVCPICWMSAAPLLPKTQWFTFSSFYSFLFT